MSWLVPLFFYAGQSWAQCLPDSAAKLEMRRMKSDTAVMQIENSASSFVQKTGKKLKDELGLDLTLRLDTENPRINADINMENKSVIIRVLGGMINHPNMNENSMYLLLCHELGHLIGGEPLKSMNGWSSTEGQADYSSTHACAHDFIKSEKEFQDSALALTMIYAQVTHQSSPSLEQCDPSEVERINFGYPSPQCRLDTLLSGWNNQNRPRCWFKEDL